MRLEVGAGKLGLFAEPCHLEVVADEGAQELGLQVKRGESAIRQPLCRGPDAECITAVKLKGLHQCWQT